MPFTEDAQTVAVRIDEFLQQAEAQLIELLWAINGENYADIQTLAKSLKSEGLNLGAKDFAVLCHEMEHMSSNNQLQGANTLFQEIKMNFHVARISLEDVRDTLLPAE